MIRSLLVAALTAPSSLALPPTAATAAVSAQVAPAPVTVDAVVPTRVRTSIAGVRVTARVGRPVRLEASTGGGWSVARRGRSAKDGKVAFGLPRPAVTTSYRVVAPSHRVTVRKRIAGHLLTRKVRLRGWFGPSRPVTVSPPQDGGQLGGSPGQEPGGNPGDPMPSTRLVQASSREYGDVGPATVALSADGRWMAFDGSDGIVPDDHNDTWDVFLHDTVTGTTTLISRNAAGQPANGVSYGPRLSAGGRFVTFQSTADDLVAGDTNEQYDVFVYDRLTGAVELVSRTASAIGDGNSIEPDISADGRYVAFTTYADNLRPDVPHGDSQVMRVDRSTGELWSVSWRSQDPAHGSAGEPSISGDGQLVVFTSSADDLVAHDHNDARDVFLRDFTTGSLRAVSRTPGQPRETGSADSGRPRISDNGSTIAYASGADDLVPDDDNEDADVFVYDVATRTTRLVSRTPGGRPGNGSSWAAEVSGDGGTVAFVSVAHDLTPNGRVGQVYLARPGRPVELVSARDGSTKPDDGDAQEPALDASGRVVAFRSDSTDLVPGTEQRVSRIYLRLRR